MYYWFYSQTDPRDVQAQDAVALKDQNEFLSFKAMSFPREATGLEKGLVASMPQDRQKFPSTELIDEIKNYKGETIWSIYRAE
jgi:hypothetical protein